MKILIADDDVHTREVLKNFLTSKGFEVSEARSSDELNKTINGFKPDGLVLNTDLKPTNGFDLCKKILKVNPNIKVIFVTKQEDEITKAKSIEAGAMSLFSKPFQVNIITQLFLTVGLDYSAWETDVSIHIDLEDVDLDENTSKYIPIEATDLSKVSFDLSASPKHKNHSSNSASPILKEKLNEQPLPSIEIKETPIQNHIEERKVEKNIEQNTEIKMPNKASHNIDDDDEFEETDIVIVFDEKPVNHVNEKPLDPTPTIEKPSYEPIQKTSENLSSTLLEKDQESTLILKEESHLEEPKELLEESKEPLFEQEESFSFNLEKPQKKSHEPQLNELKEKDTIIFNLDKPHQEEPKTEKTKEPEKNSIREEMPNISINLNQKDKFSFSLEKENANTVHVISEPNKTLYPSEKKQEEKEPEIMPLKEEVFSIKPPRKNLIVQTHENIDDIIINPTEQPIEEKKKGFFHNLFKR